MLNLYGVYRLGGLFENHKCSLVLLRLIQIVVYISVAKTYRFATPTLKLTKNGKLDVITSKGRDVVTSYQFCSHLAIPLCYAHVLTKFEVYQPKNTVTVAKKHPK